MDPESPMSDDDLAAYRRWLLTMVLTQGRSTVWCARELQTSPESVMRDFDEAVSLGQYFNTGNDLGVGQPRRRRRKGWRYE